MNNTITEMKKKNTLEGVNRITDEKKYTSDLEQVEFPQNGENLL